MVNYKEILRLLHEGCSQREIERILHTSKRKIREFLTAVEAHNLTWPLDESVTNEQIEESSSRSGTPPSACIWNRTIRISTANLQSVVSR